MAAAGLPEAREASKPQHPRAPQVSACTTPTSAPLTKQVTWPSPASVWKRGHFAQSAPHSSPFILSPSLLLPYVSCQIFPTFNPLVKVPLPSVGGSEFILQWSPEGGLRRYLPPVCEKALCVLAALSQGPSLRRRRMWLE